MELRQFFFVVWKRLWLILLATVLVTGMTFYLSVTSVPIYQATTTLEIDPGGDPRTDPYTAARTGEMVASTYVEQLKAPVLLQDLAQRLGLGLSVQELGKMISVEQVRDTQLIRISAESSDPALAKALAETLAQVFIERETGQQQSRFQAGLADLEAQIAALEASVEETQKAIASLGDPTDPENERMPEFARMELARLNSQLSNDQTRLVILLQSAEGFRLATARYTEYVTVFSPAELPTVPVRPRTMLNTVLGLISGLVLGVSTAFLLEYLDDTIRSPEDVKQVLPVGVLGALPRLKEARRRVPLVAAELPLQPVSEAFRNLRTSIQFSSVDQPVRTLLVTSPLALDGKTFTAANLATVMAQGGQSVILVDADLRRPRLHRVFGLSNGRGLSDVILEASAAASGSSQAAEAGSPAGSALDPPPSNPGASLSERLKGIIQEVGEPPEVGLLGSRRRSAGVREMRPGVLEYLQATEVENLRVLPSGPLPPNPAELLASQTFYRFVEWLTGQADVVIFDSPPVLTVTDAAVLSTLAEGTLLVVNCGETRRPEAAQAVERLTGVGGRVLGVVLNRMSRSADGYYHYYYYYYYTDRDDASGGTKHRRGIARLLRPRRRKRHSRRRSSSTHGSSQSEG